MGNELNRIRAVPRSVASGFAQSSILMGMEVCLALSAGLNLVSAVQGAMDSTADLLLKSPALFDLLYVIAAAYLLSRLWQIKSDVRGEKTRKAAVGCMILAAVMIMTVVYLGIFYYSVFSALEVMTEADMAEMGMTQENVQEMRGMMPYLLFLLGISVLQAVSFLLFRGVLKQVAELFRGKACGHGMAMACSLVSALTTGCCLCVLLLQFTAGASILYALLNGLSVLVEAGIYACMALLCHQTQIGLEGIAKP